ncbi:orotate phosphoribosyltransferase [Slackia piriformis]|uniref:orotate phosphoribosyltransferase n=1 Tax=Slackia piriformis TaxID=626934 RepID=UPI002942451D|nr:orotate phosphoribosyltransferase [Slackia piriformis]
MEEYKREFIEFMVESDVLKFGDFTLKSGRKSPFFMNAGAYVTGEQLMRLGEYYARAIHDNFGLDFDVVFGPAYKGIPLSVVTAIAVVMVEDVTTSGKSIDETYPKLMNAANVEVKGLIVSLNRMEVGKGGVVTAQQEVQEKYGFPVASIVSMAEVTEHLYNRECQGKVVIDDKLKAAIDAYYEQYGVK